jgi:hypothetical protein
MSLEQTNVEAARWLRFLARWALVTALMVIALMVVNLGGVGFAPSDSALGAEYSELLQAVRAPGMYRASMVLDALGWVMMGGTLLALAAILKSRAPIRALLIGACGIGSLTGVLGGFMRLVGISAFAAQYAVAAPDQQSALLPAALALREIISAHFVAGDFLVGAGWLLVASVGLAWAAFPRWVAGWFALAAGLSFLQGATSAVGAFSFPVLLLTVVVGVLGLHAATAVAFWRPAPAMSAATANASAS